MNKWTRRRYHRACLYPWNGKVWCSEMGWRRRAGKGRGGWGGECQADSQALDEPKTLPDAMKITGLRAGHRARIGGCLSGSPCQRQPPGGWAPLTWRPFTPLMPGGPRDPGGPCGEEKEFGEAAFPVARATGKAGSVGQRWVRIEGIGPGGKICPPGRSRPWARTLSTSQCPGFNVVCLHVSQASASEEKPPRMGEPFPSAPQNQQREASMTSSTKALLKCPFPLFLSTSEETMAFHVAPPPQSRTSPASHPEGSDQGRKSEPWGTRGKKQTTVPR